MNITWKTTKSGSFTNRIAIVEGLRFAIFLGHLGATRYTLTCEGNEVDTFDSIAEAKAAVQPWLASF